MSDAAPVRMESREVVPVELFFDLVFVFAVSQLSHNYPYQDIACASRKLCVVSSAANRVLVGTNP